MKAILLRFGELYLKGNNRYIFESMLISNIKAKLAGLEYKFEKTFGRYVISQYDNEKESEIVEKLKKVFGLYSISLAEQVDADEDAIKAYVATIKIKTDNFKVVVKRADKTFPISSMDFAKELGGIVLENNPNVSVELYNPETTVNVDIRLNKKAYVFDDIIKCQGGLPLGSAGKGLLLLSGGIDSPVAGYMIAKRGLKIEALHFHSYPYTSEEAKDKVLTLAKQLCEYVDEIKLHIVSFTKVQEAIHVHCRSEFMITIMRRIMMRIAQKICLRDQLGAIVTGESLGQVASQTMQSMTVTGAVVDSLPIFRPCLAMDKEEIMEIAKDINTYQTSILPYEDCCTVFLPKNPVIKPVLEKCEKEESFLDIDQIVSDALKTEEVVVLKRD